MIGVVKSLFFTLKFSFCKNIFYISIQKHLPIQASLCFTPIIFLVTKYMYIYIYTHMYDGFIIRVYIT